MGEEGLDWEKREMLCWKGVAKYMKEKEIE